MKNSKQNNIEIKDCVKNKEIWYKILDQWIKNNKKYAKELKYEDVIYWHNEMANNSCLVSAIWQVGGVATSEFSVLKKYTKDSIGKIFKENGSGILIVGINTPFSDAEDLAISEKNAVLESIKHCEKRFNAIYFYNPHTADIWAVFTNGSID